MKKQPEKREAFILKMADEKTLTRVFKPTTGMLKNLTPAGEGDFSKITVEIKKSAESLRLKGNKKLIKALGINKTGTENIFAVSERDLSGEKISEHLNETITVSNNSIVFHN